MDQNKTTAHPASSDKQGQYLAFIHAYSIRLLVSPDTLPVLKAAQDPAVECPGRRH